ncbi:DUF4397 domain-containing protein [Deinococcus pimensis]|uniref:DUF4397 domain-containing protein n=1 Tax=Deinococcus pimensis TaxID=309888 RepID=UPI0004B20765|nr:DUF4397 domain-containing protein [Deinococcus pimensis]
MNTKTMTAVRATLAALTLAVPVTLGVASARDLTPSTDVIFVNATGQVGLVDVYVGGKLVVRNLFPGTRTSFANSVPAGRHEVVVTRAGDGMSRAVLRKTMEFVGGQERAMTFSFDGNGEPTLKAEKASAD